MFTHPAFAATPHPQGFIVRSKAYAFTLIELLVVVAIIAILASLILPAAARAHYSGKKMACINNIRQQYLAQIMYGDDNQGRFPFHDDGSPDYHRTPTTGKQK